MPPLQLVGPPSIFNQYLCFFPWGKPVDACSWPLQCQVKNECGCISPVCTPAAVLPPCAHRQLYFPRVHTGSCTSPCAHRQLYFPRVHTASCTSPVCTPPAVLSPVCTPAAVLPPCAHRQLYFPRACARTRTRAHTHTHTHARTHARAHTHTHTHTHSLSLSLSQYAVTSEEQGVGCFRRELPWHLTAIISNRLRET